MSVCDCLHTYTILSLLCVHRKLYPCIPKYWTFRVLILALTDTIIILGKWSGLRSRAARRGGLLGWLEWNGFAMVTAGKGQGKEAFWRVVASEHLLIKRPCEAPSAIARIYSHSRWMWSGIRVVGEINSDEQFRQDTGSKEKQTESGNKRWEWVKKMETMWCGEMWCWHSRNGKRQPPSLTGINSWEMKRKTS